MDDFVRVLSQLNLDVKKWVSLHMYGLPVETV